MKKIVGYEQFRRLSKKNAEIGAKVVENQLYDKYSKNFWDMALASKVFDSEEKDFIRERLLHTEINLRSINENFLVKGWNWLKDKSTKFVKSFVDKIKSIRKGISSFVAGIKNLVVRWFSGAIKNLVNKVKGMFSNKAKAVEEELNKQKSDDLMTEMEAVSEMVGWWQGKGKSAKVEEVFTTIVDKKKSDIVAKSEQILKQTEGEAKEEANEDILYHFYFDQNLITEGSDGHGEEKKDTWKTWFMKKLSFWMGSAKELPEDGKKLKWWGKLILRIFFACLSPITSLIKIFAKEFARTSLNLFSVMTSRFGGPKPSKSAQTTPPIDPKDPKEPDNLVKEEASPYDKRQGYKILGVIPIFGKSVEYYDLKILSGILVTAIGIFFDGAKVSGYATEVVTGHHADGIAGFMTSKETMKGWFTWLGASKDFGMNSVMKWFATAIANTFGPWLGWITGSMPVIAEVVETIKLVIATFGLAFLFRTLWVKLSKVWKHHKVTDKLKKGAQKWAQSVGKVQGSAQHKM